jgi:cysteine sulfinate desulfinase/cysteine desulfurase-like protein
MNTTMVKKIFVLIAFVTCISVSAQKVSAPDAVVTAFSEKFPGVKKYSVKPNGKEYHFRFKTKEGAMQAQFNEQGKWLSTRNNLPVEKLPSPIIRDIKKRNPSIELVKADREVTPERTVFKVETLEGDKSYMNLYRADGTLINSKEIKEVSGKKGKNRLEQVETSPDE